MKKGKVIVNPNSQYVEHKGKISTAILNFLKPIAAKYGDIALTYLYVNDWTMEAPTGYLWSGNCYSTRAFCGLKRVKEIVKAGLVRKSVITAYNNRFKALCNIPTRFKGMEGVSAAVGGIYPNKVADFLPPFDYIWKNVHHNFRVGEEAELRKMLRAGLIPYKYNPSTGRMER